MIKLIDSLKIFSKLFQSGKCSHTFQLGYDLQKDPNLDMGEAVLDSMNEFEK